jgi:protein-S-isoprenylcysteine O-methyltransferase Ste14
MTTFNNPFFWALVSMFGLVGANAVVSGQKLGKHPLYGWVVVIIFGLGRFLLVLPFYEQPRFEMGGLHQYIGSMIFVVGIIFCIPAFTIKPVTSPDKTITLQTKGFYKISRNPIYLGEILWCLGWSMMFRSIIGISLVPLWWAGLLIHTIIEEESLERELGQSYLDYKKHVRGRIIPGLPI